MIFSLLSAPFVLPKVYGAPIPGNVDNSLDEWAAALSTIGPLLLLVGERSTKQLLRDVRGFGSAFSLAAAPLGLVSVVVSLLRLCGSHGSRSFLGYELESRSVAALELSRVNCNGIHAELIDGHIIRSTAPISPSHAGALGVSVLSGDFKDIAPEMVGQLRACHSYERLKSLFRIPAADARLRWCLQLQLQTGSGTDRDDLMTIICTALDIDHSNEYMRLIWGGLLEHLDDTLQPNTTIADVKPGLDKRKTSTPETEDSMPLLAPAGVGSFVLTFEAMSEFCTAELVSGRISLAIGMLACTTIIGLFIVELKFALHWHPSTGWLVALHGYAGIVTSVIAAALHIQHASQRVPLATRSGLNPAAWKDGLVIAQPSDGKLGADMLVSSSGRAHIFEAMWLRPPTRRSQFVADCIAAGLTLSFLCHYLGLRSSRWWFACGEIAVCLMAALARSLTKSSPQKFTAESDDGAPKLDWRCCSTGVISVTEPRKIESHSAAPVPCLDLRAYSELDDLTPPSAAEKLAWNIASGLLQDPNLLQSLLDLTRMRVFICQNNGGTGHRRALVVCFASGVLVTEGLASPTNGVAVAFRSSPANLAAPTGLLARGIMRQPAWTVATHMFTNMVGTVGHVHVPAIDPLLSWWTVAELRNGPRDNQENLQWAFLLLNALFFACVRRDYGDDQKLIDGLATAIGGDGEGPTELAGHVLAYLARECR
jgi:hypothetical protein